MKKSALMLIALAALPLQAALADDEYNTSLGQTTSGFPLGFHGIDPVAFVTLGNRHPGSARYLAVHDQVSYYFESAANQKAFEANPQKYLPQNGGYCTFGVAVGKKFDGDPRFADVLDGKLYVFLNEDIFKAYQADKAGTIAKANKQWKQIRNKAVETL